MESVNSKTMRKLTLAMMKHGLELCIIVRREARNNSSLNYLIPPGYALVTG
jgi:hypothetical protein